MPEQKMYFIPSEKEITSSDQIGPGGGEGLTHLVSMTELKVLLDNFKIL